MMLTIGIRPSYENMDPQLVSYPPLLPLSRLIDLGFDRGQDSDKNISTNSCNSKRTI